MHLYLGGAASGSWQSKLVCMAIMLSQWMAGCISADASLLQGHQFTTPFNVLSCLPRTLMLPVDSLGSQQLRNMGKTGRSTLTLPLSGLYLP